MTGRRSHGRLSALNGVVHQGKYWQKQALGEEFDFHFIGGTAGTGIESYIAFAYRRVSRIATLVGDDVVRRATHIAREEFGRGPAP